MVLFPFKKSFWAVTHTGSGRTLNRSEGLDGGLHVGQVSSSLFSGKKTTVCLCFHSSESLLKQLTISYKFPQHCAWFQMAGARIPFLVAEKLPKPSNDPIHPFKSFALKFWGKPLSSRWKEPHQVLLTIWTIFKAEGKPEAMYATRCRYYDFEPATDWLCCMGTDYSDEAFILLDLTCAKPCWDWSHPIAGITHNHLKFIFANHLSQLAIGLITSFVITLYITFTSVSLYHFFHYYFGSYYYQKRIIADSHYYQTKCTYYPPLA